MAPTYQRLIHRRTSINPGLNIQVIFAFQQPLVDGLNDSGWLQNSALQFFNNMQPTGLSMFNTHPVSLSEISHAQEGTRNVDFEPAAHDIAELFEKQYDTRTGGMDWGHAYNTVFSWDRDRNVSA